MTHKDRILVDALYNLSPDSGASAEYARGILIGVIAGLMIDMDWIDAVAICSKLAPNRIIAGSMPESYCFDFKVYETMNGPTELNGEWRRMEGR